MSLIAWYPLTNGTKKNIIGDDILEGTGFTEISSGKIGSTYSFDGSSGSCLRSSVPKNINSETFSAAVWVKLSSTWSGWGQILTIGQPGIGWNDIRFGIDVTSSRIAYFSISDGSQSLDTKGPWQYLPVDEWCHIVVVKNGSTCSMFVNGQPASGRATATTSIVPALNASSILSIGGNGSNSSWECCEGDISDVRIYNHALTIKEIKELSRALVLHYTFDNSSFEGTTNYVLYPTPSSAVGAVGWDVSRHPDAIYVSGWNCGYNSGVGSPAVGYHAMWNMVDGIPTIVFQNKNSEVGLSGRWMGVSGGISSDVDSALPGRTVTISFEAKGNVSGMKVAAGLYYTIGTSTNFHGGYPAHDITTEWRRYSHTFTVSASKTGSSSIYIYGHFGGEGISYVRNIQLEYKDHATEYTPTSRTPAIGDSSGLGNDGELHLPQYYKHEQLKG